MTQMWLNLASESEEPLVTQRNIALFLECVGNLWVEEYMKTPLGISQRDQRQYGFIVGSEYFYPDSDKMVKKIHDHYILLHDNRQRHLEKLKRESNCMSPPKNFSFSP